MSDHEETETEAYVPFSKRPAFVDVTPVPQDDGPFPVCPINYAAEYRETLDYFRALIQTNEVSERALEVTAEVVELNAAHYTAWQWRRDLLLALKSPLPLELEFVTDATRSNPKNYQVWFHRRWLVAQLRDATAELDFTAEMLAQDAKNYHAWTHRQWVLKEFNLWAEEAAFVDSELTKDVRNNSAWNQRHFLLALAVPPPHARGDEGELDWALPWLNKAPNNESAWNYVAALRGPDLRARLEAFCRTMRSRWPSCAPLVATLVDLCEDRGAKAEAAELAQVLQGGLDDVHAKYWAWRKEQLLPSK